MLAARERRRLQAGWLTSHTPTFAEDQMPYAALLLEVLLPLMQSNLQPGATIEATEIREVKDVTVMSLIGERISVW